MVVVEGVKLSLVVLVRHHPMIVVLMAVVGLGLLQGC